MRPLRVSDDVSFCFIYTLLNCLESDDGCDEGEDVLPTKKSAKGAGARLADLTFVFNYFLNGFCGPLGAGGAGFLSFISTNRICSASLYESLTLYLSQ